MKNSGIMWCMVNKSGFWTVWKVNNWIAVIIWKPWLVRINCNLKLWFFRATVQENIDLIKLQREVKEKSTKLSAVTEKYAILEEVCILYVRLYLIKNVFLGLDEWKYMGFVYLRFYKLYAGKFLFQLYFWYSYWLIVSFKTWCIQSKRIVNLK